MPQISGSEFKVETSLVGKENTQEVHGKDGEMEEEEEEEVMEKKEGPQSEESPKEKEEQVGEGKMEGETVEAMEHSKEEISPSTFIHTSPPVSNASKG